MKNNLLIILKYLYYFSLCGLLVLYLFPGSLVGFFLYGDIGKQPDLILNQAVFQYLRIKKNPLNCLEINKEQVVHKERNNINILILSINYFSF